MAKYIDWDSLIGKNYEDMKVMSYYTTYDHLNFKKTWFHLKCNVCGKEHDALATSITHFIGTNHYSTCDKGNLHRYDHLVGTTVGDMTILKFWKKSKWWYCTLKCNICGKEKDSILRAVLVKPVGMTHSACSHGKYPCRFSGIFSGMIGRTTNPDNNAYPIYGGRGIKCEWKNLDEFAEDMLESYLEMCRIIPERLISIERVNVNGNYCKENCRWINQLNQGRNKQNTVFFRAIDPSGKVYVGKCLSHFSIKHHLDPQNMNAVIKGRRPHHHGWKVVHISKEEYEAYWNSQPIPADMDEVWEAFIECYNKCKDDPKYRKNDTIFVPLRVVENIFCMYIPPEAIEALCEMNNDHGLIIDYDEKLKRFLVK